MLVPWYASKVAYKPKPTKKAENFEHLRDVATTKTDYCYLVVKGLKELNQVIRDVAEVEINKPW